MRGGRLFLAPRAYSRRGGVRGVIPWEYREDFTDRGQHPSGSTPDRYREMGTSSSLVSTIIDAPASLQRTGDAQNRFYRYNPVPAFANGSMLLQVELLSSAGFPELFFRMSAGGGYGYGLHFSWGRYLRLREYGTAGGAWSITELATYDLTAAGKLDWTKRINMLLHVADGRCSGKVWNRGTAEPGWLIDGASLDAGLGIRYAEGYTGFATGYGDSRNETRYYFHGIGAQRGADPDFL